MKRRIIVAGICVGTWLCASVQGQESIVTNLLVEGTLRQGVNSTASGDLSTALGFETSASAGASHAEGDVTIASGWASHAEGGGTLAKGVNSHAEGEMAEALARNSHAGGFCSQVREQDTNSFIHATGASNAMKQTQFRDTAHFDHLVTLEPALDASNAVLSLAENDQRYLNVSGDAMLGTLTTTGTITAARLEISDEGTALINGALVFAGTDGATLVHQERTVMDLAANEFLYRWTFCEGFQWRESGSAVTNSSTNIMLKTEGGQFVLKSGDTMAGSLSVAGGAILGSSTNQTNLTVAGWALIDYIPPQGGISMGTFISR